MTENSSFGCDEAGRGPVLGSLFIGFVDAPDEALPEGLADSKDLSESKISTLATELRERDSVETTVVEVPVSDIDSNDGNMTSLTAQAMATAITTTAVSDTGVVDACHPSPVIFKDMIEDEVDACDVTVTAKHGADTDVEQVMAASILAKHAREQHVDELQETHGDVGSGYPSDATTIAFLEQYVTEHSELPPFARSSWETSQDILNSAEQLTFARYTA